MQLTEEANIAPPLKTQLSLKKKNYEEPRHDLEMGLPVVDDNPKKQNKDQALSFEDSKLWTVSEGRVDDVQKPEVSVHGS